MARRVKVTSLEQFAKFAYPTGQVDNIDFRGHSWRHVSDLCTLFQKNFKTYTWHPNSGTVNANSIVKIYVLSNTPIIIDYNMGHNEPPSIYIIRSPVETFILNNHAYVKYKLGFNVKDTRRIYKKKLVKELLIHYKNNFSNTGSKLSIPEILQVIESAKLAGYKFPELDMIKKSILSGAAPKPELVMIDDLEIE